MNTLDICNLALAKLSQRRLSGLADDHDPVSLQCAQLYHPARKETLTSCRWTFATRTQFLPLSPTYDPLPEPYTLAYSLPDGCLRVLDVPLREWTLSGRKLLTPPHSHTTLKITYIDNVEDPDSFDPLFIDALACRLAEKLALTLTGSLELKVSLANEFNKIILPMAKHINQLQYRSNDQHPLTHILNASLFPY